VGDGLCQHVGVFLANGLDSIAELDHDRAPFATTVYIDATLRAPTSVRDRDGRKVQGATAATTPPRGTRGDSARTCSVPACRVTELGEGRLFLMGSKNEFETKARRHRVRQPASPQVRGTRGDTRFEYLQHHHHPPAAGQRKRTSNVARPKIFRPPDFAATMTTPVRVAGSSDLIRPLYSMSAPSVADTIAGWDSRTA
jgi:hypothetical protein